MPDYFGLSARPSMSFASLRLVSLFASAVLMAGCDPGPTEKVLIGTWEITFPHGMDFTTFMTFNSDHTMVSFGDSIMGSHQIYYHGRWSADETHITIRPETGELSGKTWEWRIVKKRSNKLYLHFSDHDYDDIWTRRSVAPPQESNASDQAKKRIPHFVAFLPMQTCSSKCWVTHLVLVR